MIVYVALVLVLIGCLERYLEHHRVWGACVILLGLTLLTLFGAH